ncbi:hypothetical protein BOTBODRAFT_28875 [Botryobasidium botryosum FD-172 SS1]|uniref:Man1/Src1-like C-terminal domain-containing protein n=1 Tax=Botryobasidium botryosum (strain FD-172 SS1) TaxID=930990 RepID=A0A067MRX5_BOTB1|nr:hypothetical protein BOTBODRAFT_28875 [Botryobasidium botryosum FD-172 SS1]
MAPESADVLEAAEYLEDDFNPNTLKVANLMNVLHYHGVHYSPASTKPKLVALFKEHITPHAAELRRQRLERTSSQASDRGIRDGITGRQINDSSDIEEIPPPPRRTTRRVSRPAAEGRSTVSAEPSEPTRRRRAPASASMPRSAPKYVDAVVPVAEASEPEQDAGQRARRVVKKKDGTSAGTRTRRTSNYLTSGGEESAWEDNNVFQSGAESSSPVKSPFKPTGAATRRTRRVQPSAPVEAPSSPASPSPRPSTSNVDAQPPPGVLRNRNAPRSKGRHSVGWKTPNPDLDEDSEVKVDDDEIQLIEDDADDQISEGVASDMRSPSPSKDLARPSALGTSLSISSAIIRVLIVFLSFAITKTYVDRSSSIGFCDAGSNTNAIIEERKALFSARQQCIERLALIPQDEVTDKDICPALPLLPALQPLACTPCPARAICTPHTVTCQSSFILRPHPLTQIPLLSSLANGFPGLGSVAFPPRCVEDRERLKKIGGFGKAIDRNLTQLKGQRICAGVKNPDGESREAVTWGMKVAELRNEMRAKVSKLSHKFDGSAFDDLFDVAMDDLEKNGLVVVSHDADGEKYIAAYKADMGLTCQAKVTARETWSAWRKYIYGIVGLAVVTMAAKSKAAANQIEARRVASLVQVALDTLKDQELAHHTDPASTPYPYLSSLHLRDLVLQDEHSIPARKRLWDKVESVVEGNANVRANIEELNGDETRVWRWVGGASGQGSRVAEFVGRGIGGRIVA